MRSFLMNAATKTGTKETHKLTHFDFLIVDNVQLNQTFRKASRDNRMTTTKSCVHATISYQFQLSLNERLSFFTSHSYYCHFCLDVHANGSMSH